MAENSISTGQAQKSQILLKSEIAVQSGICGSSSIRIVQDGISFANLFAKVPAGLLQIAGGVAQGLSAIMSAAQAGVATVKFVGIYREYSDTKQKLASVSVSRESEAGISNSIDEWLRADKETAEKRSSQLRGLLLSELDFKGHSDGATTARREIPQAIIDFARDGVFSGSAAGTGFAKVAQLIWGLGGAAATNIAGSAIGLASATSQIIAGGYVWLDARTRLAASGDARHRLMAHDDRLAQLQTQARNGGFVAFADGVKKLLLEKNADGRAVGKRPAAEVERSYQKQQAIAADLPVHRPKTEAQRAAHYDDLKTKAVAAKLNHAAALVRALATTSIGNEEVFVSKTEKEVALAKKRIIYGAALFGLGMTALLLSVLSGGAVAVVASGIALTMAMRGGTAFWTGWASRRLLGKLKGEAPPEPEDRKAAHAAAVDKLIDEALALLRDTDLGSALGRKLLKNMLRDHGVNRGALRALKAVDKHPELLRAAVRTAGRDVTGQVEAAALKGEAPPKPGDQKTAHAAVVDKPADEALGRKRLKNPLQEIGVIRRALKAADKDPELPRKAGDTDNRDVTREVEAAVRQQLKDLLTGDIAREIALARGNAGHEKATKVVTEPPATEASAKPSA